MWWPTNQLTNQPTNNVKARDPVGSKNTSYESMVKLKILHDGENFSESFNPKISTGWKLDKLNCKLDEQKV